jgi:hypothetical protein
MIFLANPIHVGVDVFGMLVPISLLFIYLSTYYSIVGFIGFFDQLVKIIPQNSQDSYTRCQGHTLGLLIPLDLV